ncbi:ACR family protein [Lysobacteraceae bacterium NML95-0200]|nr:ACR family protein [Xanthomonadaceae bacterium NML95-0200]
MSLKRIVHLLLITLPVLGCASDGGRWVELAGKRYTVEIADDDESRARGLMFRDSMPEDHGMLFIHDTQAPQAYWMKNTRIALDILYFDNERRLVSQQRDVPPCTLGDRCPAYPSKAPARYVLELNAGKAAEIGLEDGALLKFGPGVPVPH